ncbi:MAG: hypothetical protein K0A89_02790 [ANME-2 cluster archaeon]|nr:hypothetical protein [ANME-2 cluster archaeon]
MINEPYIKRILALLFLLIVVSSFFIAPSLALETRSMILTGERVLGIGESYELYQGYSVNMVEPASSGRKVIIRITFDGQTVSEDRFISKGEVYNVTRKYDDTDFIVLAITLMDVDIDELTATIRVVQYIDPSRPTTGFLIIDQEEKLEPGTYLILEQGYRLNIEDFGTDSTTLGLYKNNIMVKESKMKGNDIFNYTLTSNGNDHTIISFTIKSIFKGSTRSAVFIEHLYQFEEPFDAIPVETVTSTEMNGTDTNDNNNTGKASSNISLSVQVTNDDGGKRIYKNQSINVTYYLSGSDSFDSTRITLDGTIIEEFIAPHPGMHSIKLEPLPVGSHIIEVSAISGDGGRISHETKLYVRKNFAENLIIPEVNLTFAPVVFAITSLLLIIWAAMRRPKKDEW